MKPIIFHASDSRGQFDHGWLKTYHSFSFSGYYDPSRVHFGKLRVLNDDYVAPGKGFGTHPHENMEIITIVLEGAIEHRDSMGNGAVIRKDEVQVMSAGYGIEHSEFNPDPGQTLNLLQIWIFPRERNLEPRYEQAGFDPQVRKNQWQMLVSPYPSEGSLWIHQDAWIHRAFLEPGDPLDYALKKNGNGIFVFVISGVFLAAGTQMTSRDAAGFTDTSILSFLSVEPGDLLILEVPMH